MVKRIWLIATVIGLGAATGAAAQNLSLDFGNGGSITATTLQLIALITLLSVAPGIVITVTCFPFIVTVLSILRQAIGLQQSPPNMLIISIALFLTFFVMEPVLIDSWEQGIRPLLDEEVEVEEGFQRGFEPFRVFMAAQVDPETFATMSRILSLIHI